VPQPRAPRAALPALLWAACLETPPLVPPTVDEDPSLPAVALNGSNFHLVREGASSGTPILFLAGGPGNDALYLRRLGAPCGEVDLGRAHPLYFWDQRGAGRSRRHDDRLLRLEVFEADLDALVDHIDPEAAGVILVGHSWGGMFATSYLNRHPDRVRAVVLLEPGEYSSDIWDAWEEETGASSSIHFPLTDEWLNDFAWSGQLLTLHDHEALDFTALMAVQGSQPERVNKEAAPNDRLGGAVIRTSVRGGFYPDRFDFTDRLEAYPHEVLVIAGDTPTSDLGVDFQRFQLDALPTATLEVIPGAGHTDVVWADACTSLAHIDAYFARRGVER
jgi:proline iminopeptidase